MRGANVGWRSVYKFDGEFGSFNILVPKSAAADELVRVSFVKTAD